MGNVRSRLRRFMANLHFRISVLRVGQVRGTLIGLPIRDNFRMVMRVSGYGPDVVIMRIG